MQDQNNDLLALIERGETITLNAPVKLTHRTQNDALTIHQIDPTAIRKTKQGRRGEYVGFYTYDSSTEEDKKKSSELDARYGSHKIDYLLPAGSKVLDLTGEERGMTSRINSRTAKFFLNNGYDAVMGYDYIGPIEWVVLRIVLSGRDANFIEVPKNPNMRENILRAFIKESIRLL